MTIVYLDFIIYKTNPIVGKYNDTEILWRLWF